MPALLPPRLLPGARIGIIAPASPPSDPQRIEDGIAWLMSRGYDIVRGQSLSARDGYLAGDDALRAADLQRMFANPSVDAVFCLRGGYGSGRLLERIAFDLVRSNPKILLGFSDVTALSLALLRQAGMVTFGGPMVAVEMAGGISIETETSMWDLLTSPDARPVFRCSESLSGTEAGNAEGPLLGGNLAVVTSLLGTPYLPDFDGAVLLLEDVGESVYRIDRMLLQLHLAGCLSKLRAVLLGHFTDIPEDTATRSLQTVFQEYFSHLGIPVLSGFPFGHTADKATVPWGVRVHVDVAATTVSVLDAAVR